MLNTIVAHKFSANGRIYLVNADSIATAEQMLAIPNAQYIGIKAVNGIEFKYTDIICK